MPRFQTKTSSDHAPDYQLIAAFGGLIFFGLLMLSSAGVASSYQTFGDSYYLIKHQLLYGLVPGLVLCFIFSKINYQFWKRLALPLLAISLLLLITVFIPGLGSEYGTARSWIHIGNFSLQPAEIVKLTVLLYLAQWLARRDQSEVKDLYISFLPFLFFICIISVLMLLQPDMGTLAIIIFMCMAIFFASGAQVKHVAMMLAGGATAIYLLILKSPYRAARLTTFLHPELDPQGIGYHINQAFLAIGSGGFFGRGFGMSRQKFQYLPEVTGDSIFAIIGEELGFLFCVITIGLFVFIAYRSYLIAKNANSPFGRLVAVGIMSWFSFQAFFNIASMVGLSPMTGVPLPFISYGGTAMAIGLAALGILINISKQTKISL